MASASALMRGEIRRVSSATSKALGRVTKIAGPLNGARGAVGLAGGVITISRVPPGGFPRPGRPTPPTPPGPSTRFIPGEDPFAPSPSQPGGLSALCALIPEARLRALCELGKDFFGGEITPPTERLLGPEGPCDAGFIKVGTQCIDPDAFLPGGKPLFQPDFNGQVVQGGFGLPATQPQGITRITRKCPRGMVLGIDDLCYAKAILPGRSKLRKWRRPPRPPITRRDTVAIRRAAGARDRVFELAKDVGLHVAKSPHRKKAKK